MPDSLPELLDSRNQLLQQLSQLGDFQPGSISSVIRRCGKPNCHCAQPHDAGHAPQRRLTQKIAGKTVTQTLPSPTAVRKAEKEIAEFRRFQNLAQQLIEVNQKICRLRPLTAEESMAVKKNGGNSPAGDQPGNRAFARAHFLPTAKDRRLGSGSGRDGSSLRHAPSGSLGIKPTARVRCSWIRPAPPALSLRAAGEVCGLTLQAGADRRRGSALPTPLLPV